MKTIILIFTIIFCSCVTINKTYYVNEKPKVVSETSKKFCDSVYNSKSTGTFTCEIRGNANPWNGIYNSNLPLTQFH